MVYAIDKLDGVTVYLWADDLKVDNENRTVNLYKSGSMDGSTKDEEGNIYATFYLDKLVGMYNMDDIVGFREVLGIDKETFIEHSKMANMTEYEAYEGDIDELE